MQLSLNEIAKSLGSPTPRDGERIISILLTDSRSLTYADVTLFFAIKTDGNDGHKYIRTLYEKGVKAFVVTEIPEEMKDKEDADFFIVEDTITVLQRLSSRENGRGGEVVAIVGSRGKTTLKEWIFQLMEPLEEVGRSPRSYNSKIGVPLSLWELNDETTLSLIEAGVSRKGEMSNLAKIINPDTVIFTNINDETHSSGFPSIKEKSEEKALIASGNRVRTLIYKADYLEIKNALKPYSTGKRVFDWTDSNFEAMVKVSTKKIAEGIARMAYEYQGRKSEIEFPYKSEKDSENAANALCFMLSKGIDDDVIKKRFHSLHLIGTRLNVTEAVNGCSVIYDSYTSDFHSLGPALDFMKRRANGNQTPVLVLSDLRHESDAGNDIYRKIASLVDVSGIHRFIGIGEQLCKNRDYFKKNAEFYKTTDDFLSKHGAGNFSNEIILLKGSPDFEFWRIYTALEARKHETVLEVNLDSIVKNFNHFRRLIPFPTGIICMVKASGYGAGSFEIARTLQDCGAAYLAVAVLDEGIELRSGGISMPIMVLNPRTANYRQMFVHRLEPVIYTMEMLTDVINAAELNGTVDYPIHLKLDTGMHRMGFVEEEFEPLCDIIRNQNSIKVKSVFTHLATADCPDMDIYTLDQLDKFDKYSSILNNLLGRPFMRHALNSAGIIRFPQFHYDMVRLGIGLYGVRTLPEEIEGRLETVSTLRSVVISVRNLKKGEAIGYGRRDVLQRDSIIATIPIGYADGMNRKFGCGAVKVRLNGKWVPTIGSICMDACMLDVTGVECRVGDEVEIFGKNADIQRLADVLETIPYEILTSVSPRVKRVYFRE